MKRERVAGDTLGPERYPLEELRSAALKGEGELARPLALALLGRVDYPQKVRDMELLLMDDAEEPRLRSMAADVLGGVGTPPAVDVLERALTIQDDVALRGVLHGLSLSGAPHTADRLQPLSRRRGAVGNAVRGARDLLRHRLGSTGTGVQPPAKTLRISVKNAVPIEIRPASRKGAAAAIADVSALVPSLSLTPVSAVTLKCFGRDLMFVFDEEMAALGVVRLSYAKAEAGVVLAREVVEGNVWEVKHHVLTQPREDDAVDITVTSGRGRPLYSGKANVRGDRAEFTLRAVDTRGVAAIDVRGTFENGRLTFSEALSDPTIRSQAASPKPRA